MECYSTKAGKLLFKWPRQKIYIFCKKIIARHPESSTSQFSCIYCRPNIAFVESPEGVLGAFDS